jgi:DNA-binding Lrp family transcriptional regulator
VTALQFKKLDRIDVRILSELQKDGRITNQALSDKVGLSARACLERVKRLEKDKIITHYQAVVDVRKVQASVFVIAQIALEKQGRQRLSAFEKRLKDTPEVIECFEVSGTYDYIAKIACPDLETYQDLTDSWIDDPELGVTRVVTNVVLRPLRDLGVYPLFGDP